MGTNLGDYMNDDTEFLLTQAEKLVEEFNRIVQILVLKLNDVYWLESNEGEYV